MTPVTRLEWDAALDQQVLVVSHKKEDPWNTRAANLPDDERGRFIVQYIVKNYDGIFEGLAHKTAKTYKSAGKHFVRYFLANPFNKDTVRSFSEHIRKSNELSQNTKGTISNSIKRIIKYVARHRTDLIDPSIMWLLLADAKLPSTENTTHKEGFHPAEIKKIEAYLGALPESLNKVKLLTQFKLFWLQGFRIGDMCNVKLSDFDFIHKKIKLVRKKSNKQPLYMHDTVATQIKQYVTHAAIESGLLFPIETKYKEDKLRGTWKSIFQAAGCEHGRVPHDFRHHLAYWTLDKTNGSILDVATALGHKGTASVQHYLDNWVKEINFAKINQ